jgi:hypothetical protein
VSGLPRLGKGRPSPLARSRHQDAVHAFCARILEINSTLDFRVSSRGRCYLLENAGEITKGEFDDTQKLINTCRKTGLLPVDICSEDECRAADGIEDLDDGDVEAAADWILSYADHAHESYTPFSFWDDPHVYVEIAVEKVDLKSLFAPIAEEFHVLISNNGGWADINGRVAMMRRFRQREAEGKQCVLLYCGDHDPGGLAIGDFLCRNVADLKGAAGWSPARLHIDRFGLNYDFIQAEGLTWIDNLETGSGKRLDEPHHPDHYKFYVQSYLKRFGARKVEANTLVVRPVAGRELCRQAILRYMPMTAIEDYERKLAAARDELRDAVLSRLRGAA